MDVKTRRGVDIDSDHQLLVGVFRLRPAAIKKTKKGYKYNINRLQNQSTVEAYNTALNIQLNNRARSDDSWQTIVDACNRSAQTFLGHAVNRRKPWITDVTWAEIKKTEEAKHRMETAKTSEEKNVAKLEYRITANNVKTLARIDREMYYNNIADEAEQASNVGNMRQVYAAIKN
ncbi:uncharacterized protein [Musca autumnalis]|uniref:uncharacterized protein n=1 Tax=Musca autumnalis TaxID=221902 RepID=UPI003CEB6EF8